MTHNFLTILEQEKDGTFSTSVPSLPGCFSQGETFDDAVKNTEEAISLYIAGRKISQSFFPKKEIVVPIEVKN